MRRSDRGTIVRIELRSLRSRIPDSCLRLYRISISAWIDRSNLSLNKARSRTSNPTVRLYSNFNRTLAEAVESATICARMMYREMSPRRRRGDVTKLFD